MLAEPSDANLRSVSLGRVRSIGRETRSEWRRSGGNASLAVTMLTDARLSDVTGPLAERSAREAGVKAECPRALVL
jgi:hypothetical protein